MAAKRKQRPQTERRRPLNDVCPFCANKVLPDYKNYQELEKFVTDRRKILGRSRSGVCAKHQKVLAREIKRARHIALLPFSGKFS
jgi:small subunit ribosomal protein S18